MQQGELLSEWMQVQSIKLPMSLFFYHFSQSDLSGFDLTTFYNALVCSGICKVIAMGQVYMHTTTVRTAVDKPHDLSTAV